MNISIVIPVFNSDKNLENLLNKLIEHLSIKFKNFEIILIDDESSDNSWQVIKNFCTKYDYIKGVQLRKNVGQHNAIFAGLKFTNGKIIVTMDDDGQNSPEDIDILTDKMKDGFDVVYANYKVKKHNIFRRFGSFINNLIASFLFNKPLNLTQTSFRCFLAEVKNEIIKSKSSNIYLDGIIFSTTKNITNVYVEHKDRQFGKSNYSFFKLLGLWSQMATGFSILPLRMSSILGLCFSIFSFCITIWLVFFREMDSDIPMGWTSLIVAITFFGGVQLLALGLIGEYLGRTYLTVNNSQQYSEKEIINIKNKDNKDND
jgi:polyisoprenyl-phosphate glycosyltransferase